MEALPVIYFVYMFVSFYFLIMTLLLYFKNKNSLFHFPKLTKAYSLSVLIPAFNEEKTIAETIRAVAESDYPNLLEIIVINDGSSDRTLEIAKSLMAHYKKLKIINKKNSGKADSLNKAIKFCNGDLIAVVDADSFPAKDAFSKIAGYFDDSKVGAATASCFIRDPKNFLEKMQAIEYRVIAFTRKLLEYVDSIYVIPGALAVYRKAAVLQSGFDTKNITEDIEATWHLLFNGWKVKMCLDAIVTTKAPSKFTPWYKQRRRWGLGGLQCLDKYKSFFLKKGMLGLFIIPFFALGLFLGLIGMAIFVYLISRRMISSYLLAKYSIETSVPIITMSDLYITPSILNYFGLILIVLYTAFTFYVLAIVKDNLFRTKQSFFNLVFYITIYLLAYPFILMVSIWHFIRKKHVWR